MFSNKWILVLGFVVVCCSSVFGQDPDDGVIRIGVDLVTVNVSVTERKDRLVRGLKPEDFLVSDEGKRVQLEFFESNGPASIVFVVDISSSMRGTKWVSLEQAMKRFLARARAGSDYTLIVFGDRAELITRSVSADELWRNLEGLRPNGNTALYDGVLLGLGALDRLPQRHKALVLLSDGQDNSSQSDLSQIQHAALTHRATIYAVGLLNRQTDYLPWEREGKQLLDRLATSTGGLKLFPVPEQIESALEKITADVSGHYCLSYYPPDGSTGWRNIHVGIQAGSQELNLRYQARYLRR